jgi:hypothetical protein
MMLTRNASVKAAAAYPCTQSSYTALALARGQVFRLAGKSSHGIRLMPPTRGLDGPASSVATENGSTDTLPTKSNNCVWLDSLQASPSSQHGGLHELR